MKRITKLSFLIIFFLFLLESFTLVVIGDCEKPEWEVGDEWKYDLSVTGIKGSITHRISEITIINVNGTDYEVFHVEVKGAGGKEHIYYSISDLSLVKMEVPSTTAGSSLIFTYDPPKKEFDFPLVVGKTWNSTYTETIIGLEYDPINVTKTENYSVVEIESVSVKAGTFDCYRIESHDDNEITITTRWYSKEVKNLVKSYVNISGLTTEMELISFGDGGEKNGSDFLIFPDLILFILFPIIILVLIIILLVRSKRKKAKKPQPPQTTTTPSQRQDIPPPPPPRKPS